ncbi:hypothetical protein ACIOYV_11135 [Pseudomonas sp. NPDC087342]|uniref:hypothetical protein n=1 Tax=Pseudomonas sp. NPDC087342 TaxID=3364437 RepID=UPI003810F1E3
MSGTDSTPSHNVGDLFLAPYEFFSNYVIKGDAKTGIESLTKNFYSVADLLRCKDVVRRPAGWTLKIAASQKPKVYCLIEASSTSAAAPAQLWMGNTRRLSVIANRCCSMTDRQTS